MNEFRLTIDDDNEPLIEVPFRGRGPTLFEPERRGFGVVPERLRASGRSPNRPKAREWSLVAVDDRGATVVGIGALQLHDRAVIDYAIDQQWSFAHAIVR